METHDLTTIVGADQYDPEAVLLAASHAAKALQRVVESKPRKVTIQGKQYLQYEDWLTLGQFYRYSVRTGQVVSVEVDGVRGAYAKAEVIDLRTGENVGGADAYCMSDEENWVGKPWFQLASMAQTRAGAKALRNRLAWVAVLAGYEPTPAEEMTEDTVKPATKPEHYCEQHDKPFRRFEKEGRVWYSHKEGNDWCNEAKARETTPPAPKAEPKPAPPQAPAASGPAAVGPASAPPTDATSDLTYWTAELVKQSTADDVKRCGQRIAAAKLPDETRDKLLPIYRQQLASKMAAALTPTQEPSGEPQQEDGNE